MTPNERVEQLIKNGLNPDLKPWILAALESQMFDEREACAKKCENWADGQDRMSLLKDIDAASAQSHSDSALICRRMAASIRKRTQTEALKELTESYGGYDEDFGKGDK